MMRIDTLTAAAAALAVTIVAVPSAVSAQLRDVRVAGQYQLLHVPGTTFPAGVNGELSAVVQPPLVVLAEAGWAPKQLNTATVSATARLINFGAGLRVQPSRSRLSPFVQAIVGGINVGGRATIGGVSGSGSTTAFQIEPGAGLHAHVRPNAAITASVHLRRVFLDEATFEKSGENQVRALLGVSVRIAR
jgi:hypothetical protein